ncbi:hypothetical protein P167DRAFT_569630 [Morchella conica CCBAS932]|uniref:Uncharacterized protein n=1 Tax=Morchella conica CCBAS932 TaxID=1392247 RepID=A0A3N4L5U4_9PEZI|nr:hypothetical protein P167DRAFT_569630 [Morchella conica CCBAS932]
MNARTPAFFKIILFSSRYESEYMKEVESHHDPIGPPPERPTEPRRPRGKGHHEEKEYGLWGSAPEVNRAPVAPPRRVTKGLRVVIPGTKPRDQPTEALLPLRGGNSRPEEVSLWDLPQRPTEFVLAPLTEGQTQAGEGGPCGQAQGPPEAAPLCSWASPGAEGSCTSSARRKHKKGLGEAGGRAAREAAIP